MGDAEALTDECCCREDAPWGRVVALPPLSAASYGTIQLFGEKMKRKKAQWGDFNLAKPNQVSEVLKKPLGCRSDPATQVSSDMVPPRGTRLPVSHSRVPAVGGHLSEGSITLWVLHLLPCAAGMWPHRGDSHHRMVVGTDGRGSTMEKEGNS